MHWILRKLHGTKAQTKENGSGGWLDDSKEMWKTEGQTYFRKRYTVQYRQFNITQNAR